jgi:hypothetical protein
MYLERIVKVSFGRANIDADNIKAVLNRQAPNIDPKGIKTVDAESLDPATMAVMMSGAPLAKARKVTPAKVGDISESCTIY